MANNSEFLLVHFKNTNEYSVIGVIEDKNNKFLNAKKMKIKKGRRWCTGEIIYRGSERKCLKKRKKMEINVSTREKTKSESEIESAFDAISSKRTDESVEIDNLGSSSNIYQESTTMTTLDDEARCSKNCINLENINEMIKNMENLKKNTEELLGLFQTFVDLKKRKYSELDFPKELMFNGKNLLDICASSQSKYVTSLMEILFSPEERQNGIIAGVNSTSKRIRLNEDKVKLLKDAIMIKYKVPKDKNEETWKECREIANRKCFDTKKTLI